MDYGSSREVLASHDGLRNERRREEPVWRALAKMLRPDEQDFDAVSDNRSDLSELFDSSPLYALDSFVGGMFGQLVNPANRWFELGLSGDPELAKARPVADYLHQVATAIYATLSPAVSNFYAEASGWLANLGAFGWGVLSQEEAVGKGVIVDRALPIGQVYFDVDDYGEIARVHREFRIKGAYARRRWGNIDQLRDDATYIVVHAVCRNEDYRPGALGPRGKPWLSSYVSPDLAALNARGGYFELPFHIPQWNRRAGRVYPSGPGHLTRADAQMLQEMERTDIVAAQWAAEPAVLLHDDSVVTAADLVPNAVLYGTINDAGKAMLQQLNRGANVQLLKEKAEQKRAAIREAFYYGIMQLVNRPQMTATEFLGFQEEKLRLMGPNLVRIQTGGLSPFIARRFRLLERAGQLPSPPREMQGRPMAIEYVSPLAKALQIGAARAVLQVHGAIEQFALTDPSVRDKFDADIAAETVGAAFSSVPGLIRDRDQVTAIREARAKQMAAQAGLDEAQQAVQIAAEASHARQAASLAQQRGGRP